MSVSVDASELRNLGIEITLHTGTVPPRVKAGMTKIGYDIERSAKTLAPVDTGNLRNSIGTDITSGGTFIEVAVAATTDYADYVEYGTTRMSGQPFMGPAFDRHHRRVYDVLGDAGLDL